jgi:hypothetical protein
VSGRTPEMTGVQTHANHTPSAKPFMHLARLHLRQ